MNAYPYPYVVIDSAGHNYYHWDKVFTPQVILAVVSCAICAPAHESGRREGITLCIELEGFRTGNVPVDVYNDTNQIAEILYKNGLLDESGLLKLQEAELYIRDRLAQERAKQLKQSIPHAHQTTVVEIISA